MAYIDFFYSELLRFRSVTIKDEYWGASYWRGGTEIHAFSSVATNKKRLRHLRVAGRAA